LGSLAISLMLILLLSDAVYSLILNGAWRANFWLDAAHIARQYSTADDELGFVRKPRVSWKRYVPEISRTVEYRTDDNGFRNALGVSQAQIVFIGDSYTEAAQVAEEETFVQLVAQASGLSVVNLGRGAYGPQQELIVLQRYGLGYRPRVVVWQFFEGNDLTDANEFAAWKKNPTQSSVTLKDRYLNNSFLTQWLARTRLPDRSGSLVTLRYQDGNVLRLIPRYSYDQTQPNSIPDGFSETMRTIKAGYQLCQNHGIRLVIVFVPTMIRVMEPYVTFERPEDRLRYLPGGNDTEPEDFSRRSAAFCAQLGCSFIDSFAALRKAASEGKPRLYVPNDEHLDVGGHEVVAQTVVDWLQSQRIVNQGR
jgi:hypothetical protein